MAATDRVIPVILCGGSGTRLWPLSRATYPKQFGPLMAGASLFQRTLARLAGHGPALLLTNAAFRFLVAEQLSDAGAEARGIVVEPAARNTAPAVAAAAHLVAGDDPDAVLAVAPSDHLIADEPAFHAALDEAAAAARAGHLVTFGIRPDRAETGYGYIELAGTGQSGAQPFRRFVEKPDAAAAAEMVASGRFLWNSGMFVFTARAILEALAAHAPEVDRAAAAAVAGARESVGFTRLDADAYGAAPSISLDYAVMERVAGTVVPVDCGWSDLGSWKSVREESRRDGSGTATSGNVLAIDCEDSLLRSDHGDLRLVGIGLRDIVAVAMRDAVLVADIDRAQDVREAVAALAAEGAPEATEFPRCYRPWGWYETLVAGPGFQVKEIMVKPGGRLSLQSHRHRSEHWVVVAGAAQVTVDEDVRTLTVNQSTYIPLGAVHRLENLGEVDMHLIEVQCGDYLGEDDIVRYEDIYARD